MSVREPKTYAEWISKEQARVSAQLERLEPTSEEYGQVLRTLSELEKLYEAEKPKPAISPETWLIVGANLLGVLMIITHERTGILSSNALRMVPKLKQM